MKKNLIIACLVAFAALTVNAKTGNFKAGEINILHTDEFMEMFGEDCTVEHPIVIDVSAEWCGWCKKMHPHLEQLAKKYKGQIDFFQINYETDLELIQDLGVSSYPTLIYIRPDGSVVVDEDGFRTANKLDEKLQKVFYGEDESMVRPSGSWPATELARWPSGNESWPGAEVASWPSGNESWPGAELASWPSGSESWPGAELASWPSGNESWPTTSWPII